MGYKELGLASEPGASCGGGRGGFGNPPQAESLPHLGASAREFLKRPLQAWTPAPRYFQVTVIGCEASQAIVSVTPLAMSAQALVMAERRACSRVSADDVRQEVRPWYRMHTSTRTRLRVRLKLI